MEMNTPYKVFKTDAQAEAETGAILDYGDFRVRIRRAGGSNKKFERAFKTRFAPYSRQLKNDTMQNEIALQIMAEIYAETVIIGWESKDSNGNLVPGIHDENGNIVPFNRDNTVKILTAIPDLFRDIQEQADKVSLWRSEDLADQIKNSSTV